MSAKLLIGQLLVGLAGAGTLLLASWPHSAGSSYPGPALPVAAIAANQPSAAAAPGAPFTR
jgi:hypothetical protein